MSPKLEELSDSKFCISDAFLVIMSPARFHLIQVLFEFSNPLIHSMIQPSQSERTKVGTYCLILTVNFSNQPVQVSATSLFGHMTGKRMWKVQ